MKRGEIAGVPLKYQYFVIAFASTAVYVGVISGPFLHDDNPAILTNPDVQGNSKLTELFSNDFWGTPMKKRNSHKSYRPLTVLVFRCIHSIWGNWSPPYHVINIILHSTASLLFFTLCRRLVFCGEEYFIHLSAGLLFALHPIHTEAVCGIVGCAELLSAICFISSLLIYPDNFNMVEKNKKNFSITSELGQPDTRKKEKKVPIQSIQQEVTSEVRLRKTLTSNETASKSVTEGSSMSDFQEDQSCGFSCFINNLNSLRVVTALLLAALAMLCKESGVTVLGVILIREIFNMKLSHNEEKISVHQEKTKQVFKRLSLICIWCALIVSSRMAIMEWTQPVFDKAENPAFHEKNFITRVLTYFSLYWINFGLLVYPINLCYDYSYGTIPIISSCWNRINVVSLLFLFLCLTVVAKAIRTWKNKEKTSRTFVLGCSIMVCSFLPASNIFFPVGFVIAERVLYMPSAGYVILLVLLWNKIQARYPPSKQFLHLMMIVMISFYSHQTIHRTFDWTTKERFLKSGVNVAPQNAKIRYNWANYLQANNRTLEAAKEYEKVLELHPTYVEAINNLGTVLEENPSTREKAEEMYVRAIQVRPRYKHAYFNLAKLLLTQKRHKQATKVLLRAIKIFPGCFTHVTTMADFLVSRERFNEAERIYMNMLNQTCLLQPNSSVFNKCPQDYLPALSGYANLLTKKGEVQKSLKIHNSMMKMNSSNADVLSGFSDALAAAGRIDEAATMMLKAVEIDSNKIVDLWRLASILFEKRFLEKSKNLYKIVAGSLPDNKDAVGQYAAVLYESGEPKLGEKILLNLTRADSSCKEEGVWDNLATLYGQQKRHKDAISLIQTCFKRQKCKNGTESFRKQRSALLCLLAKHELDYSKQLADDHRLKNADILQRNAIQHLQEAIKLDLTNIRATDLLNNVRKLEENNP